MALEFVPKKPFLFSMASQVASRIGFGNLKPPPRSLQKSDPRSLDVNLPSSAQEEFPKQAATDVILGKPSRERILQHSRASLEADIAHLEGDGLVAYEPDGIRVLGDADGQDSQLFLIQAPICRLELPTCLQSFPVMHLCTAPGLLKG